MQDPHHNVVAPRPASLPSRFSALLRELAYVPEEQIGSGWDRALAPGITVEARFELVREIGRGGFGVVWEALDTKLGRPVAFKAVRAGTRLEVREERLLREAEAAAQLSHPNIVTLHDVGRGEQGPYLIFELLRGRTLAQRIEAGTVPVPDALRVAVEIAKGLAHAQAKGVVHRDLTPGNVFLCDDGQVKLLDLGMAHAFGQRREDGGTPGYMAPEQQRGAPEDERTDVFALGVILYRMLAGEVPFPDDGSSREAPALDVPGVSGLGDLVARMLKDDPVARPRGAGEVLTALAPMALDVERRPTTGKPLVSRRRRSRLRLVVPAATAALFGLAGAWVARHGTFSRAEATVSEDPSIAVLPFDDVSPQRDQGYFADGLADEILNALAHIEGLRVPGRTSSFSFKGRDAKVADIGRELRVRTVLEGSVRRSGNRVRVTAQVVNVADGFRIWSQTYDRELTDIFAVQDDIARSVATALDVKLVHGRSSSIDRHATKSSEAYTQLLLGRQQYHLLTREGWRNAIAAYDKAIALDPGYAPAWAEIAGPLFLLAEDSKTAEGVAAMRRRALAAAEKAVSLSPELSGALSTRGYLRGVIASDWAAARADVEHAIAINPGDPDAHRRYGVVLYALGSLPEAIAEVRRAFDLDPLGSSLITLGTMYDSAGQHADAEAAFRRHLRTSPGTLAGLWGLSRSLLLQRKTKEALATIETFPSDDYKLWGRAIAEHDLGNEPASREALDALVSKYSHSAGFLIAQVYAWRGDRESAFRWLERAKADPASLALFTRNPFFRNLSDDPRFAALAKQLKLPVN